MSGGLSGKHDTHKSPPAGKSLLESILIEHCMSHQEGPQLARNNPENCPHITDSKSAHVFFHTHYASHKPFYLFHNLGLFAEFFLQRRQELRAIFQLFTTRIIVAWTESQIESILTLAPLAAPPWPPPHLWALSPPCGFSRDDSLVCKT